MLFFKKVLCRIKLNSKKSGTKNLCVCVHMRTHTSVRDSCTLHHIEQLAMPLFEIFILRALQFQVPFTHLRGYFHSCMTVTLVCT